MRNSPRTVTTRETVSSWMACTSADRATAPGKYTGVLVQVCRQGHCSRQVHRRASTGLQTGSMLQANTQACQYRSADRVNAPGKYTGVPVQECRQGHCSRQVHRNASTGLQTGPCTAPGKYAGVPVQGCRQGHCSRQVHRSASTGLQTGPLLHASTHRQYKSRTVHYHINQEYTCDKPQPRFQLKGTVSRDFRLLVFFINQFPPIP
jgi:hypothetical protein